MPQGKCQVDNCLYECEVEGSIVGKDEYLGTLSWVFNSTVLVDITWKA